MLKTPLRPEKQKSRTGLEGCYDPKAMSEVYSVTIALILSDSTGYYPSGTIPTVFYHYASVPIPGRPNPDYRPNVKFSVIGLFKADSNDSGPPFAAVLTT